MPAHSSFPISFLQSFRPARPTTPLSPEHRPAHANNPYQWFVPAAADLASYEDKRGLVRNVVLRNVKLTKAPSTDSILIGYNDARGIEGVQIEGLEIEGKTITTAAEARMHLEHVKELRFR